MATLLGLLALPSCPSWAQTLQWDTNLGASGAQGGTGVWTGTNLWYNSATNQNWSNGSVAIFGGTSGTVTLNSAVSADSVGFLVNGYTISGSGTLTLTGNVDLNTARESKRRST